MSKITITLDSGIDLQKGNYKQYPSLINTELMKTGFAHPTNFNVVDGNTKLILEMDVYFDNMKNGLSDLSKLFPFYQWLFEQFPNADPLIPELDGSTPDSLNGYLQNGLNNIKLKQNPLTDPLQDNPDPNQDNPNGEGKEDEEISLIDKLKDRFDKMSGGASLVGIGLSGYLAYKFWTKSLIWKVGIGLLGAATLYTTYNYFSKKITSAADVSLETETETNPETQTEL